MRTGRTALLSTHDALASVTRRQLVTLLADRTPRDAQDLAGTLGLHVSTIRFHLNVLARAGMVSSRAQPRATTGRPRTVYTATRRATDGAQSGYVALSGLLAAHFGDTPQVRAERAERAGRHWAAELAADHAIPSEVKAPEVAQQVSAVFAEMGFEPELTAEAAGPQIRMHACPFRTVAREHPDVVCSVHLGVLRGTLTRLGVAPEAAALEPFVEPELCIAHLALP